MLRMLLAVALLSAAAPALAQWNDDAQQCWQLAQANSDPDERIDICTRAIESGELTQKNLAATHNNRGGAYVQKGELDRAIADFDQSLKLYPGYPNALFDRGLAYGLKGDYERAIPDFDALIRLDPKLARAYNGRCYTLALMGEAKRAIEDCNQALALEPNTPYILDSRAYAYLRAGDFRRALADYDLILQLAPKTPEVLFSRGIAKLRLGRQQEGEQDLADARTADTGIDAKMAKIGLAP